MNRDIAELEERFQQLNRSRSALSAEMRASAAEFHELGVIPSEALDRSIVDYRELFGRLQVELGLGDDAVVSEAEANWDMFHERLRVCRQATEAVTRLHAVDRLNMPVDMDATRDQVRHSRDEVAARISKSPWDEVELIQEVREGRHSLCRLVSLVERLDELTDDEWTTEMTAVQQSFGVPLSTAIARRKVELAEAEHDLTE